MKIRMKSIYSIKNIIHMKSRQEKRENFVYFKRQSTVRMLKTSSKMQLYIMIWI